MSRGLGVLAVLAALVTGAAWSAPLWIGTFPLSKPDAGTAALYAVKAAGWSRWGLLVVAGLVGLSLVALRLRLRREAAAVARAARKVDGPPSWWRRLPWAVRTGVQLVVVAALAAAGWGLVVAPAVTVAAVTWAAVAAASICAAAGGWWATDRMLTRRHRRQWVTPLHVVLSPLLSLPGWVRPRSYLRVPPGFSDRDGEVARVAVPATWSGADLGLRSAVQSAVTSKLALSDVSFRWQLAGRRSWVEVHAAPRPPSSAPFTDPGVRDRVRAASESAPLIGLGHRGSSVSVDLDAESPHILVSAGTGGGKSTILRTIFAQLLHHGAEGVVLDIKRHSHKWVRGVPGVEYCREIEDIHAALIRLGEEGRRRNRVADEWDGDESAAPVGPRMTVLIEEANATIGRLKRHWQATRTKDDPKESPAVDALAEVLFMGRAVRMHVLLVAQSATAAALGGPEMRENFATRILARYSQNAWRMLAPEIAPPRSPRHIGRAQVVLGGTAHETQVVYMEPDDARAWAMTGRSQVAASQPPAGSVDLEKRPTTVVATAATGMSESKHAGMPAELGRPRLRVVRDGEPAPAAGSSPMVVPAPAPAPVPVAAEPVVSLRAAVESGVLSCSLPVARKSATGRDPEFPEPAGLDPQTKAKLYRPDELRRWERNRPRAGEADRTG